jgi:CheY-like chemotaxis protein
MKRRKIMVVDESRLLHRLYDTFLRGDELLHAHDGAEALALLERHPDIDVLLLDPALPRITGLEVLARVKADPARAHLPVVLVSTRGEDAAVDHGLRAGAAAYVCKPFHFHAMLEIIGRRVQACAAAR